MIIKNINPDFYEVDVQVKEIIFGNTQIDKISGWNDIESTIIKLRCTDCTIMVFKDKINLFKNIKVGDCFMAIVKEWKEGIYNFKSFSNRDLSESKKIDDKILQAYDEYSEEYFRELEKHNKIEKELGGGFSFSDVHEPYMNYAEFKKMYLSGYKPYVIKNFS